MKELSKTYFRQDVADREQEILDGRQANLQKSVQELSELMNITISSVEQLECINPEWLEEKIRKSESNLRAVLGADTFIPAGISKQFADNYSEVRQKASSPVENIVDVLAYLKENGIGIKIDSKGRPWLNEKDVKAKIEEKATFQFSESDKEAYPYFAAVFEALNELLKFQKAKKYAPCNLQEILTNADAARVLENRSLFDFNAGAFYTLKAWGKILMPIGQPKKDGTE